MTFNRRANYFGNRIHRPDARPEGNIKTGVAYCPVLPFRRIDPLSEEGQRAIMNAKTQDRKPLTIGPKKAPPPMPITPERHRELKNHLDEEKDFGKWKDLFFVIRSSYKITPEGNTNIPGRSLARRRKEVEERISDGRAGELLALGHVRPIVSWDVDALKAVVCRLTGNNPRTLSSKHFKENGCEAVFNKFKGSAYICLVKIGYAYSPDEIKSFDKNFPAEKIYPWELSSCPNVFHDQKICMAAVRWLVSKTKKPSDLCRSDFKKAGVEALLKRYVNSPYLALVAAGYAYSYADVLRFSKQGKFGTDKLYPWEMKKTPTIYKDPEMRRAAVRWLVSKIPNPRRKDFYANGLGGLLHSYYDNKAENALKAA